MKICTYLIIKVITENVLFPRHQAVVSRTEQGSFNKNIFISQPVMNKWIFPSPLCGFGVDILLTQPLLRLKEDHRRSIVPESDQDQ